MEIAEILNLSGNGTVVDGDNPGFPQGTELSFREVYGISMDQSGQVPQITALCGSSTDRSNGQEVCLKDNVPLNAQAFYVTLAGGEENGSDPQLRGVLFARPAPSEYWLG